VVLSSSTGVSHDIWKRVKPFVNLLTPSRSRV